MWLRQVRRTCPRNAQESNAHPDAQLPRPQGSFENFGLAGIHPSHDDESEADHHAMQAMLGQPSPLASDLVQQPGPLSTNLGGLQPARNLDKDFKTQEEDGDQPVAQPSMCVDAQANAAPAVAVAVDLPPEAEVSMGLDPDESGGGMRGASETPADVIMSEEGGAEDRELTPRKHQVIASASPILLRGLASLILLHRLV
jgi:hypothetical protein